MDMNAKLPIRTPGLALAQVTGPQVCPTCQGEEWLVIQRGAFSLDVPCPGCCCRVCGKPGAGPECGRCFDEENARAERREDR